MGLLLIIILVPLLAIVDFVLLIICLTKEKIHPILAVFCFITPFAAYFIHSIYFPPQGFMGEIAYWFVQLPILAIIFAILQVALRYEKHHRRNYYRDADEEEL